MTDPELRFSTSRGWHVARLLLDGETARELGRVDSEMIDEELAQAWRELMERALVAKLRELVPDVEISIARREEP